jgi:hypothetical protein
MNNGREFSLPLRFGVGQAIGGFYAAQLIATITSF